MRQISLISGHPIFIGFLRLTGCQRDPRDRGVTDLLRVEKPNIKIKFVVYKLAWFSRNPRWERVMSLGDVALLVGTSPSISVTASDFPGCQTADDDCVGGCQSNSIYFANHLHGGLYVFNLNDNTPPTAPYINTETPRIWICPKSV